MKYRQFFRSNCSKMESVICNFTNSCTPQQVLFQSISPQVQHRSIKKRILMAASENNVILEIFLNGCFSKAAANILTVSVKIVSAQNQLSTSFKNSILVEKKKRNSSHFTGIVTPSNSKMLFLKFAFSEGILRP